MKDGVAEPRASADSGVDLAVSTRLLERLALPFECVAPGVGRDPAAGEPAWTLAVRLARAKALTVVAVRDPARSSSVRTRWPCEARSCSASPATSSAVATAAAASSGQRRRIPDGCLSLVDGGPDVRNRTWTGPSCASANSRAVEIARYVERDRPSTVPADSRPSHSASRSSSASSRSIPRPSPACR